MHAKQRERKRDKKRRREKKRTIQGKEKIETTKENDVDICILKKNENYNNDKHEN